MSLSNHDVEINAAIDRYAANGPTEEDSMRTLVGRARVLPLLFDWSAVLSLTPEGRLIWLEYEPPNSVTPLAEDAQKPNLVHIALAQGFLRFPELEWLPPRRGSTAIDCKSCGGTGTPRINGQPAPSNVVCGCGGLGWLPE